MSDWLGRLIWGAVIGGVVGFVIGGFAQTGAGLQTAFWIAVVGGWLGFLSTPSD